MADFKVAVGSAQLDNSLGTQDLTIAGLGWTPKMAFFAMCGGLTDRAETNHFRSMIGAADDNGNSWGCSNFANDLGATKFGTRMCDFTDGRNDRIVFGAERDNTIALSG